MDWFERLTGFREESYEATRTKLSVEGGLLHSLVNGKSYGVGEFELASLQTLRERAAAVRGMSGRLKVSVVTGDVRKMHQAPECAGALIQVASQFNVLEMTGPSVSPEEGVTRYVHDRNRWFCRLGLDGRVPDHSTFSKNRHGRFRESGMLRRLFAPRANISPRSTTRRSARPPLSRRSSFPDLIRQPSGRARTRGMPSSPTPITT
jgi:hypothetical protein